MCLINPTDAEFRTGRGGRFEVADGPGWTFFGSFSAGTDHLGPVYIGPHSGYEPLLGFHAQPSGVGPAEYLMVPALPAGRYRFSHPAGTRVPLGPDGAARMAYGEFEVNESAPVPVPIEIQNANGGGLSAYPILLPPSGGEIAIQGFSRERVLDDFPVDLNVQAWVDSEWDAPLRCLTPRPRTDNRTGPAVDLPPLPPGPYRLSCLHPDLGKIGRVVWVVEGLPGAS